MEEGALEEEHRKRSMGEGAWKKEHTEILCIGGKSNEVTFFGKFPES